MEPRRRFRVVPIKEVEQAVYRFTPAATTEIAKAIGVSRQTADEHLQTLEQREVIWKKKVGPTNVWMHPRVMPDPDPDRDTDASKLTRGLPHGLY
jgi:predicted transcriptional regulator